MSGLTKIEWADKVWNPVTGCTKISEGCRNCYAERMAKRLAGRCGYPKENPFAVTLHPDRLEEPLHWKKPSRIFVCSMGDLFHEEVPLKFIAEVFNTMVAWRCPKHYRHDEDEDGCFNEDPGHTYLILTKRPKRMKRVMEKELSEYVGECWGGNTPLALEFEVGSWPPDNLWLGVSVENQKTADERIPLLLQTPAVKRFVSYEPALGPIDFAPWIKQIDWLIMGGESGPGARPMHPDWARSTRDQCKAASVPFFFKQWGLGKKAAGCLLDGREWKETP